jgi:hypothetical protein
MAKTASDEDRPMQGVRSGAAFVAMVAGVALCVRGGAPLLLPAAALVALLAVPRPSRRSSYLALLIGGTLLAVAIGIGYGLVTHAMGLPQVLVSSGLVLIVVARLQSPIANQPSQS